MKNGTLAQSLGSVKFDHEDQLPESSSMHQKVNKKGTKAWL